jgi:hypothetical protein
LTAASVGFGDCSLAALGARLPLRCILAGELRDVGPGDERAPRAREQHRADVVPCPRFLDRESQLAHQGVVQRIQLVRPVRRDRGDPVGDLEREKLVAHFE